jgi:hypothetical protein
VEAVFRKLFSGVEHGNIVGKKCQLHFLSQCLSAAK